DAPLLRHAVGAGREGYHRQDEAVRHVLHARSAERREAARRDLPLAGSAGDPGHGGRVLPRRAGYDPMKKVRVITDGSCLGNPGPGGWAAVLRYNHHAKEIW